MSFNYVGFSNLPDSQSLCLRNNKRMKKLSIIGIIVCIILLTLSFKSNSMEPSVSSVYHLQNIKLGISFPPVRNQEQLIFSNDKIRDLNVNHIRFAENWKHREPINNQFDWTALDTRINFFHDRSINFILTIQSDGPDWVKNNSSSNNKKSIAFNKDNNVEFVNYLEKLLQRYRGKIKEIQFGNEWQSNWWYSGSKEEFARTQNLFYTTVKNVDPKISVILGGFSIDALRALAASQGLIEKYRNDEGELIDSIKINKLLKTQKAKKYLSRINYVLENSRYDVIDIHLYDDPENWKYYLASIKSIKAGIPVIVSEFGGPNTKWINYSDSLHEKELVRYIKALDNMNIKYALYFELVESRYANHEKSGLINKQLKNKPGYYKFKKITEMQ